MAIHVEIEKSFKGFSLKTAFDSKSSATGILGASGSGKSMTLRCIAGIEKPDKGKIIINGRTVFDSEKKINLKPQERRIGYLFQNYALFPTMTVKDNIKCGFRGEKGTQDAKVADFVKRYHLDGLENRYPSQLSGGQQQRVALARMMIGEPEAILLDEPFSALDGYLKDTLQKPRPVASPSAEEEAACTLAVPAKLTMVATRSTPKKRKQLAIRDFL